MALNMAKVGLRTIDSFETESSMATVDLLRLTSSYDLKEAAENKEAMSPTP